MDFFHPLLSASSVSSVFHPSRPRQPRIENRMQMKVIKNISIPGSNGFPIALDIFYQPNKNPQPVLVYAHGFNGFKDWGNFDSIAKQVCLAGFVVVKFNFSHNGTSPAHPTEFVNLEAFGLNNYSKQLYDLEQVVDWIADPQNDFAAVIDAQAIYLLGHSMGGGIGILFAARDPRIKKLVTWASISECKTPWGSWPAEKMLEWRNTGVQYYKNSRTGQDMPLFYQLYEDYQQNKENLDVKKAIAGLNIPVLICHGTLDPAVPIENAYALSAAQPAAELFTVPGDHVFGRKHPWTAESLPEAMQAVLEKTIAFLK
jgi:dienelactone hydrolase